MAMPGCCMAGTEADNGWLPVRAAASPLTLRLALDGQAVPFGCAGPTPYAEGSLIHEWQCACGVPGCCAAGQESDTGHAMLLLQDRPPGHSCGLAATSNSAGLLRDGN